MKIIQLGGAFHQSFFIEELCLNQFDVECLDNIPDNPGHNYATRSHNISIIDTDKIKNIFGKEDIVFSSYGSDIAEFSRSILTKEKGNHLRLLKKISARKFLKKVFSNQNQPNIKIANLKEDINIKNCLIKPNISSGSKGIHLINSKIRISDAIKNAQAISIDGVAVLEEYINNDGNKYYCEGLIIKNNIFLVIGCSTSSNATLNWDGSVQIKENNILFYTELSYDFLIGLLKDCILKMAAVLDKDSFAFNIDFFINHGDIIIIEFALRPGGNLLPLVLEHTYGINHSLSYLSILKGNPQIIYRKNKFLKIDSTKCLNISITKDINSNDIKKQVNNIITLKRKYSHQVNQEKLIGRIYGT